MDSKKETHSLTMSRRLRATLRRGNNSRGARGQVAQGRVALRRSFSVGYGTHIPLSVRRAVDAWEAEAVAHQRTTQPLR